MQHLLLNLLLPPLATTSCYCPLLPPLAIAQAMAAGSERLSVPWRQLFSVTGSPALHRVVFDVSQRWMMGLEFCLPYMTRNYEGILSV